MRPAAEPLEARECPAVTYHGGVVLSHPLVAEVFAGPYRADLDADVQVAVTNYAPWFGAYGVGAGAVDAVWQAGTRDVRTQAQIEGLIREGVAAGRLPGPSPEQMYMIFSPSDIGAFHSFFGNSPYGVSSLTFPAGGAGPSHEVVETATDPYLEAWFQGKPAGGEVADLVAPAEVKVSGRTMAAAVGPDGALLTGPTPLQPVQPFPLVGDLFILMAQNFAIAEAAHAQGNTPLATFAYNSFLICYFWVVTGHYRFF